MASSEPSRSSSGWPKARRSIGRALATWTLALYPLERGRTRLISRVRAWIAPTARGIGLLLVLDPGQFLMERKMLLGIKRRAERLAE